MVKVAGKMRKVPGQLWNYDEFIASMEGFERKEVESGSRCPECGARTTSPFVCQPCQRRGL
jgi:tRNA(Ile2) C34 agmatinyltransferase TiaS